MGGRTSGNLDADKVRLLAFASPMLARALAALAANGQSYKGNAFFLISPGGFDPPILGLWLRACRGDFGPNLREVGEMGCLRLETKSLELCISAASLTAGVLCVGGSWARDVEGGATGAEGGGGGRASFDCRLVCIRSVGSTPTLADPEEAPLDPSVPTLAFSLSNFSNLASQARSSLRKCCRTALSPALVAPWDCMTIMRSVSHLRRSVSAANSSCRRRCWYSCTLNSASCSNCSDSRRRSSHKWNSQSSVSLAMVWQWNSLTSRSITLSTASSSI